MVVQEHEHEFVTIIVGSELRLRCKRCTAVRLLPNPGDSDEELEARIVNAARDPNVETEEWASMMARFLQRQYERETGYPAFPYSQEYCQWLKRKKLCW